MSLMLIIIYALGLALLSVVQWTKIAKKKFNKSDLLAFSGMLLLWHVISISIFFVFLLFLIDPQFLKYFIVIYPAFYIHFTLALNLGLTKKYKKSRYTSRAKRCQHFLIFMITPGLQNWKRWMVCYILLFMLVFLAIICSGLGLALEIHQGAVFLFFLMVFMVWWRFVLFEMMANK